MPEHEYWKCTFGFSKRTANTRVRSLRAKVSNPKFIRIDHGETYGVCQRTDVNYVPLAGLGKGKAGKAGDSSVRSPTRTATEVRSPTSTSTEVRSPTSTSTEVRSPTSTSTETDAYTSGNVTVTGGAGAGATTTVTIRGSKAQEKDPRHARGRDGVRKARIHATDVQDRSDPHRRHATDNQDRSQSTRQHATDTKKKRRR